MGRHGDEGVESSPEGPADDVIAAARAGAEWAWRRVYEELAPPIEGYLRVRGAREPEDLLGETFVHLTRGIGRFEGGWPEFRSWTFMVAHHRLVDERRRLRRRPPPPDEEPLEGLPGRDDPETEALERLATDRVRRLFEMLTSDQRDVLSLRVIGGLTLEETAQVVGKRIGAVKQLQRRGLKALRRTIDREGVTL